MAKHPPARAKTELVWEGKYDDDGNRRPIRLPVPPPVLRCLEEVDGPAGGSPCGAPQGAGPGQSIVEPEPGKNPGLQGKSGAWAGGPSDDARRLPRDGAGDGEWRNLLVWADNKLAVAALLERFRGRVDLIYVDPPFDAGGDLPIELPLGETAGERVQAVAYRDSWGRGADSYLQTMYERLALMKELLSERGNLFVHVDYRANSRIRLVLDEIFGPRLVNEIIWQYNSGPRGQNAFGKRHDTLYRYALDPARAFMATDSPAAREPYSPDINIPASKAHYYHPLGKVKGDVWRINILGQNDKQERTGFGRQKPEALLEQIIATCCPEDGLVADLFCGSGTTLAAAEKLGRRWIGVDLGRYAIQVTRKRLIGVQRALQAAGRPYRPFDVYDLGSAERAWWEQERLEGPAAAEVVRRYDATPAGLGPGKGQGARIPDLRGDSRAAGSMAGVTAVPEPLLDGLTAGGAAVHVGPLDGGLTTGEVRAAAAAARAAGRAELHCLAWEIEAGVVEDRPAVEAETGVPIRILLIPREVMEPNRRDCPFFEAGCLEARAAWDGEAVGVELTGFRPALPTSPAAQQARPAAALKRAGRAPFDLIDSWAVDFDYIAGRPFKQHWQAFRTRADRRLALRTGPMWTYSSVGPHVIAVKAIDLSGIETVALLPACDPSY